MPVRGKPNKPPSVPLRDSELARRFVLEGLLLQSVQPPAPEAVSAVLEWYLEAAVEGFPLPPIGVVADVGHLAFGREIQAEPAGDDSHSSLPPPQQLSSTLRRQYEDLFLGKLYGDRSFDRGVDGLRRYSDRRDRAKGLAFLIGQLGRRAGYRGVELSPAVLRDLLRLDGADVLKQALTSLGEHGPIRLEDLEGFPFSEKHDPAMTLMEFLYQDVIVHTRNLADALGTEDVFELEHGTAISGQGPREGIREVLRRPRNWKPASPSRRCKP